MSENYEWYRFWCPSITEYHLTPQGYLIDPEQEFSQNSHLITAPMRLEENCIILLGEPGIGKTKAMDKYKQNLVIILENSEDKVLFINMRSIGNEIHFKNMIFDNPIFQEWINGNHKLYLLLDSFDECYLRASVISGLLVDTLKNYHLERLYIRIACRTGYWPSSLQTQLMNIFSNNKVSIYTLTPLRKQDVENAARVEIEVSGLKSPLDFIQKIEDVEAVPFATRPITLKALIKQYNSTGTISSSKGKLYRSYCHYLCEEINQIRRDENLAIRFTSEQKYIVAARIAALCVFSGKYGIWTGAEIENMTEEYIPQSILRRGQEAVSGQTFDVTNDCITETLACGLFDSLRPRRGWAHWSFLEFLAADYIKQKEIPLVQLLSLIKNPIDRKVIPQLRGVVAWLCSFNNDLCQIIIEKEPEIIIQADITLFSDEKKEMIFRALLDNYETSSLQIRFFDLTLQYKKLNHSNLANQIQEYILNPDNPHNVKYFAIRVAKECDLNTLSPILIRLLLNDDEHIQTRIAAGHALESFSHSSDIDGIEELIPLALSDESINDHFDLKGLCLNILWPQFIGLNDLIEHLPEPILGYGGSYFEFIIQNFIERLPETEIAATLIWFQENSANFSDFSIFHEILEQILAKSLNFTDNEEIFNGLAQTLSTLILNGYYSRHESSIGQLFQPRLRENQDLRRRILKRVLQHLPNERTILIQLINFFQIQSYGIRVRQRPRLFELIEQNDLEWFIEELEPSNDDEFKQKLAFFINRLLPRDSDGYNLAYILYQRYPVFHQYFIKWFGPIELDSDLALRMQQDYERDQELEEQIREMQEESRPPQIIPSPQDRMVKLLDTFEQGDLNAWWRLNRQMTLDDNSITYGNPLNSDLTTLPGWNNSPQEIRSRMIAAAKRYITEAELEIENWIGTNTISRPSYAGYRAIRLIFEIERPFIDYLTSEIWRKWIPIILLFKFQVYDNDKHEREENIRSILLQIAYPQAKEELITALSAEIDLENENDSWLSIIQKIDNIWDNDLGEFLQEKVLEEHLKPSIKGDILDFLVSHDFQPTKEYISNLLLNPIPESSEERELTIRAARALMINSSDNNWDLIYSLIQEEVVWGRELIKQVANAERFSRKMCRNYSEDQLADLYIWTYNQFPYEEDTDLTGRVRFLNNRDFIGIWRDDILNYLESKGTFESVYAIQKIIRDIPQNRRHLSYRLLRAQELARMKTWEPPKPQEIYDMIQNSASRLIQSGEHLLDILIESLERLEDRLQGRYGYTPGAISLWDYRGHRLFRPKYEDDFSDYVKNHLLDDLNNIVINREVDIDQRSTPDLLVNIINQDASHDQNRIITAVIEVKGSWHQELSTAMRTQLYERYMIPRRLQYGLYLVGGFRSQYWDPTDYKSTKNIEDFESIDDLRAFLEEQAQNLSEEGFLIKSMVVDASLNEIHLNRYSE